VVSWLIARRLGKPWAATVLVLALAVGSYLLMIATVDAPDFITFVLTGFYSPLSRAWEFAAGAVLALAVAQVRQVARLRIIGEAAGVVGLGMLVASLWLIGPETPYPSSATLLPVVGTLLVILAGSLQAGWSQRLWGSGPLTWMGDRSYSLYLWHWPMIVFALAIWPLSTWVALVAAIASAIPAVISFRFIETPFRRLPLATSRQWRTFIALAVALPIALSALTYVAAEYVLRPLYASGQYALYPESIGDEDLSGAFAGIDHPCADQELLALGYVEAEINHCYQSKPDAPVMVAIIGDSHAEHLYPGIARGLPDANVASYFSPSTVDPSTTPFDRIFANVAASPSIHTVVVNSFWGARGVPVDALSTGVSTLTRAGKRVIVTSDVPGFPFDPEVCKFRLAPAVNGSLCDASRDRMKGDHESIMRDLRTLSASAPGVEVIDTWNFLCPDDICSMTKNGQLLYRDPHHINSTGSSVLADVILERDRRVERAERGLRVE